MQPRVPTTIVVNGQSIEVGPLTEAVEGLCQARRQAATDVGAARTTFDQRSRPGIDTTTRILQPSYSRLVSSMVTAVDRVHAGGSPGPDDASLGSDLGRILELMRESLAVLGVSTPACGP